MPGPGGQSVSVLGRRCFDTRCGQCKGIFPVISSFTEWKGGPKLLSLPKQGSLAPQRPGCGWAFFEAVCGRRRQQAERQLSFRRPLPSCLSPCPLGGLLGAGEGVCTAPRVEAQGYRHHGRVELKQLRPEAKKREGRTTDRTQAERSARRKELLEREGSSVPGAWGRQEPG